MNGEVEVVLTPRDREDIRTEWADRARFLEGSGEGEALAAGDRAVEEYDAAIVTIFL